MSSRGQRTALQTTGPSASAQHSHVHKGRSSNVPLALQLLPAARERLAGSCAGWRQWEPPDGVRPGPMGRMYKEQQQLVSSRQFATERV